MMLIKKIDWYIIRKYLAAFFFVALLFSLIAVVIDFSEKIDDYLEDDIPAKAFIFDYYFNYIPYINGLLWPVYAILTVIFFTSRMAYDSEIISIFSSGTSFYRLMWPYFLSALVIGGMHYIGNHYVIPNANKTRVKFENTYIWKNNFEGSTKNMHIFLSKDTKMYIRRYSIQDSLGYDMTLEQFDKNKLKSKLFANRMEWLSKEKKWQLKNYWIREFRGKREFLTQGKSIDTLLQITPYDLERRDNLKETMTTNELITFIDGERSRGATNFKMFEVERYRRTADPFTIFILTFIGMAIAARKVRGGMGLHLALGAGLSGGFVFLSKFSTTFSTKGNLPPEIGVWIPNIIFSVVIIFLIWRAQK